MSTLTARFRRLGSEAEADDRAAGHGDPISDAGPANDRSAVPPPRDHRGSHRSPRGVAMSCPTRYRPCSWPTTPGGA